MKYTIHININVHHYRYYIINMKFNSINNYFSQYDLRYYNILYIYYFSIILVCINFYKTQFQYTILLLACFFNNIIKIGMPRYYCRDSQNYKKA